MINNEIFAFIFDSGRLGSTFYGKAVFENMLRGKELSSNASKIIVSLGDIIFDQNYIDIEPFVIKDEFCTIDFDLLLHKERFQDFPFCWIVENLSTDLAQTIDRRLKKSLQGYVGLSHIDPTNSLIRKQFWKNMIRKFSIFKDTIICFQDSHLEGPFIYLDTATELGYKVKYCENAEYISIEESSELQSNVIKSDADLEIMPPQKKDIDRNLFTLNFSIREELQISGSLIWRSINSLDKIHFSEYSTVNEHLIEYPFLTLYHASQGIERIQKAIIELICKKNHIKESEKDEIYELLMSHEHECLNQWIEEKMEITFNSNCKKLISVLRRFYNTARYARYSDETYTSPSTSEINLMMELKSKNCSDVNCSIKNNFGNFIGQLTNTYYKVFHQLCNDLNIYAYEIESDSPALIVYGLRDKSLNLYTELKRRQKAKKEILYWLIKAPTTYPKYSFATEPVLNFDAEMIEHYLNELISTPEDSYDYFDEVDYLYDELCTHDKEKWKQRLGLLDYLFENQD